MPAPSESKAAPTTPNIQDVFLNYARRERARRSPSSLIDGVEFEGRIKNFDRFAVIVERDGTDHMIFKHAIATDHARRAAVAELLHATSGPVTRAAPSRASSSSSSTASASANCPTPRYGDEGSNTLGNIARQRAAAAPDAARRSASSRHRRPARRPSRPRRPRRAFGRMAEASPGKDSVTGHWEMMGLVLDRPFPTFPHGFPAESHRASSSGASAAGRSATWPRRAPRSSTTRRRAHAHRRADRLHVGRQRVPDRRARGRRPGAGAVPAAARSPTSWSVEGLGRRPRHRAAVRRRARARSRARRTATTTRCRRRARRCSIG